jgi:hypothetical protein
MNQNPEKTKESGEGAAGNQVMPGRAIRVDEDMIRTEHRTAEIKQFLRVS